MAANLAFAEGQPERAEVVLRRRGIAAVPENMGLEVLLTEALIQQNKLQGE